MKATLIFICLGVMACNEKPHYDCSRTLPKNIRILYSEQERKYVVKAIQQYEDNPYTYLYDGINSDWISDFSPIERAKRFEDTCEAKDYAYRYTLQHLPNQGFAEKVAPAPAPTPIDSFHIRHAIAEKYIDSGYYYANKESIAYMSGKHKKGDYYYSQALRCVDSITKYNY